MGTATALLALLLTQTPEARVPLWVTFDVANPATLGGHRILHLEDVIGPRARNDIPKLPSPKVVLIFTVSPDECRQVRRKPDLCADIARLATTAWAKGSLVIGVVLASRETASVVRSQLLRSEYPYPVTLDEHGLLRRALRADRPGVVLVVDSRAEGLRLEPPDRMVGVARDRYLGEIRVALESALSREKEDEE